jgi:hypothetical protein
MSPRQPQFFIACLWHAAAIAIYAAMLLVAEFWTFRVMPDPTGWDRAPTGIEDVALQTSFFASFFVLPVVVTLVVLDRLAPRFIRRIGAAAGAVIGAPMLFTVYRSHLWPPDILLALTVPPLVMLEILRRCTRWRY